jgi:hypothetical protein
LERPELRRQTTAELNKGEARNALVRAVCFHRLGRLRDRAIEAQQYRASGLALVTAAIALWNTVYLSRALEALRRDGEMIPDALLAHLAPVGWQHINLTGDYLWDSDIGLAPDGFRPLRSAATNLRPATPPERVPDLVLPTVLSRPFYGSWPILMIMPQAGTRGRAGRFQRGRTSGVRWFPDGQSASRPGRALALITADRLGSWSADRPTSDHQNWPRAPFMASPRQQADLREDRLRSYGLDRIRTGEELPDEVATLRVRFPPKAAGQRCDPRTRRSISHNSFSITASQKPFVTAIKTQKNLQQR